MPNSIYFFEMNFSEVDFRNNEHKIYCFPADILEMIFLNYTEIRKYYG